MFDQVKRVIDRLAVDVGTPVAFLVRDYVNKEMWAELQQLRVSPSGYTDSESYWKDTLVVDLLRKCDLPSSIDREKAALKTFWECETQCFKTNLRLARYLPEHSYLECEDLPVMSFIDSWRKEVDFVLGNLPVDLTPRFSQGATYADKGLLITIPDKMSSTPTIYADARCILPLWESTSWCRALCEERPWQSDPETVRGNVFFTVPKDGTKFRGCAKEASIPVTYQLDVGRHMKKKLLRIGIDLLQGQQKHQLLAKQGSVDGSYATIDMSNASDTVCRNVVKLVLRGDWYDLLNSLRAHFTLVDGKWVRLEKFSSMGNGFTFELETVVFVTLARVLVRQQGGDPDLVKCYGDDLIVPSEHYSSVVSALRLFGFTPNMNKTFAEGPFRESCGGDFWSGVPVRAHTLENIPNEPHEWISLANGLRRVALANLDNPARWDCVRRAWLCVLDYIPSNIRRCRGPEHLGDIVIHDKPEYWDIRRDRNKVSRKTWVLEADFGPVHDQTTRKRISIVEDMPSDQTDDMYISAYMPIPSVLPWNHWFPAVQLASCTLGMPSQGVTPRGAVSGYRVKGVSARLTNHWLPTPRLIT